LLLLGAVLSLLDARRAKKGQFNDMILQLPFAAKQRIHGLVRDHRRGGAAAAAAFLLGAAVSVLELGCTGQIYLPTLVYLARSKGGAEDIALLAIYNMAFIIPLFAVFLASAGGLSSKKIGDYFSSHVFVVKIVTAILFLVFSILMLYPIK